MDFGALAGKMAGGAIGALTGAPPGGAAEPPEELPECPEPEEIEEEEPLPVEPPQKQPERPIWHYNFPPYNFS